MNIKEERLREKGWSEEEIHHAKSIVKKIKKQRKKHPHKDLLGESVYWFLVAAIIGSIIALAYWTLPLFIFLPEKIFYPLLIIIGLSFGMLLWIVVKDLDHLEARHHAIISTLIPLTGGLSFSIILGKYSELANSLGTDYNILSITLIFIFSYAAPYAYHLNDQKKGKGNKN